MNDVFSLFPQLRSGGDCPDYDCREGSFMRLFYNVTKEAFFSYAAWLASAGFEKRSESSFGALSYICLTGRVQIHLIYSENDGVLRVVACENAPLPDFEQKSIKGDYQTTFYMFENDHTLIDCGMCLLTQCADYSFFVVDSGHYYQFNDNDRIYKFMRERTPADQKVVVCGWFITHAHSDHISKLIDFLKYNMDDVVIEAFYSNLISNKYRQNTWGKEEMALAEKLFAVLEEFEDIPKIKLRSGQRFYIRELMFDVLCTHEDVYPEKIHDYNDSCAVLMMTARGTRILIPGDASALESRIMEDRYKENLKCDVLQIAHHGHFGLSKEFYELAKAGAVLFPITQIKFDEEYPRIEANRRAIELADEYHISSNGTLEVTLPYKKGNINKLPDESFEDFDKIKGLWGYEYTNEHKNELIELFKRNGGDPSKLYLPVIDSF